MLLPQVAPEPALSVRERALLERHRPIRRSDRDYRSASVVGAVQNAGNLLRAAHGEMEPAPTRSSASRRPALSGGVRGGGR